MKALFKQDIGITCLNCGTIQVPPNRPSIDNWSCNYCYSGFISMAMLANLVPPQIMKEIRRPKKKQEVGRGCPTCRFDMEKTPVQHQGKMVILESCRDCRLLWFDSGDLMRALRYRPEEGNKAAKLSPQVHVMKKPRGVARPHFLQPELNGAAKTSESRSIPKVTLAIAGLWFLLFPLAINFPRVVSQFCVLPAAPFENFGLPWISSLFVFNDLPSLLLSLLLLLVVGHHAEQKLGSPRFLGLFLISGLVGRFTYVLAGGPAQSLAHGASDCLSALAVYWATTFPFVPFLFPEERWRSPAKRIVNAIVAVIFFLTLYSGWDFIQVASVSLAHGMDGTSVGGTFWSRIASWLGSASFKGQVIAGLLGLFCYAANEIASLPKDTRTNPDQEDTKLR